MAHTHTLTHTHTHTHTHPIPHAHYHISSYTHSHTHTLTHSLTYTHSHTEYTHTSHTTHTLGTRGKVQGKFPNISISTTNINTRVPSDQQLVQLLPTITTSQVIQTTGARTTTLATFVIITIFIINSGGNWLWEGGKSQYAPPPPLYETLLSVF